MSVQATAQLRYHCGMFYPVEASQLTAKDPNFVPGFRKTGIGGSLAGWRIRVMATELLTRGANDRSVE